MENLAAPEPNTKRIGYGIKASMAWTGLPLVRDECSQYTRNTGKDEGISDVA